MLENVSYSPLLYTRVSETRAFSELPLLSKDRIFPLFLARPWPNAKKLDATWARISHAVGNRRFALGLDQTKFDLTKNNEAQYQFNSLFNIQDGFANYYRLFALNELKHAIPVLQYSNTLNTSKQVDFINGIDRGCVIHLRYETDIISHLDLKFILEEIKDVSIVIDSGWSRDLLFREAWASGMISTILNIRPDVELIASGSSFPEDFTSVIVRKEITLEERLLFNSLKRRHNDANLFYGDWGSTRPPRPPTPMGVIPRRIDLPLSREWISFRQENDEGFLEIAERVISDPLWPNELAIWGTYKIKTTALGLPDGIKGLAASSAARINIHLHRQAHFDQLGEVSDVDEPWSDD